MWPLTKGRSSGLWSVSKVLLSAASANGCLCFCLCASRLLPHTCPLPDDPRTDSLPPSCAMQLYRNIWHSHTGIIPLNGAAVVFLFCPWGWAGWGWREGGVRVDRPASLTSLTGFYLFFGLIWTKWCLILKTQLLYLDGRPLKQSEGKMPVIALAIITEYHCHYHSVFTRLACIGFMLFCQPLKMDNTVVNVWFLKKEAPHNGTRILYHLCCCRICNLSMLWKHWFQRKRDDQKRSASDSKPSGRLKQTAEGEVAQPVIKLWKMPSAVLCQWLIQICTWPAAPGGRLSWKQMTNMREKKGPQIVSFLPCT